MKRVAALRQEHLPSLDGWRAVAILMVLLSHFTATRGFTPPWWWTVVFQGNLGVRIFFVISGLLITYLLLVEADRRGSPSLRSFYTRRILRIFPVYFFYLAVLGMLTLAGLYEDTTSAWLASLTFMRNFIGKNDSLTGRYWSLAVEEQFYLVWPITLVALRLWERRRLAIGLLLVPIALGPLCRTGLIQTYWPNPLVARALNAYSTALYVDSLAVGCLGAFALWTLRDSLRRASSGWLLGVSLATFGIAALATGHVGGAEPLLPLVEAVAILCAMGITIDRRVGIVYHVLNAEPMVWLGVLSYSLYVWQELFVSWAAGRGCQRSSSTTGGSGGCRRLAARARRTTSSSGRSCGSGIDCGPRSLDLARAPLPRSDRGADQPRTEEEQRRRLGNRRHVRRRHAPATQLHRRRSLSVGRLARGRLRCWCP